MLSAAGVTVREYVPSDYVDWLRMRRELWSDSDGADAEAWACGQDNLTLVAEDARSGRLVGFAEVGKRAYADGCRTSPVAFLEGWYVSPDRRDAGIGAQLVRAAVSWAQQAGLHELASDSLLDNVVAHHAHLSVGFEEVERSIKYRMFLDRPSGSD